jgi:hypothetical protein
MSKGQLTPTGTLVRATAPTIPTLKAGDLYFNSTLNVLFTYTGTAWVNLINRGAPVTNTATTYTVLTTTSFLINSVAASCTLTLPTPATFAGRELMIKTTTAFTTISASANVVPVIGGSATTAILSATAGKYAKVVSDGTNWIIMSAN